MTNFFYVYLLVSGALRRIKLYEPYILYELYEPYLCIRVIKLPGLVPSHCLKFGQLSFERRRRGGKFGISRGRFFNLFRPLGGGLNLGLVERSNVFHTGGKNLHLGARDFGKAAKAGKTVRFPVRFNLNYPVGQLGNQVLMARQNGNLAERCWQNYFIYFIVLFGARGGQQGEFHGLVPK